MTTKLSSSLRRLAALTAASALIPSLFNGCAFVDSLQPPPVMQTAIERPSVRLAFKNTPLSRIVSIYEELSGKTYAPGSSMRDALVDLEYDGKFTRSQVDELLEYIFTLSDNTLLKSPDGKTFTLVQARKSVMRPAFPSSLPQIGMLKVNPKGTISHEGSGNSNERIVYSLEEKRRQAAKEISGLIGERRPAMDPAPKSARKPMLPPKALTEAPAPLQSSPAPVSEVESFESSNESADSSSAEPSSMSADQLKKHLEAYQDAVQKRQAEAAK